MEVTLDSFTFSSKFECGNLAKVVPAGNEGLCWQAFRRIECFSLRAAATWNNKLLC